MIHNFKPFVCDFARCGGEWLGAAREWIKRSFVNGDTVYWGSQDILSGGVRVCQLEDLASLVANKTFNQVAKSLSSPYRIMEFTRNASIVYDYGLLATVNYKAGEKFRIRLLNHDYEKNEITFKSSLFEGTATLKLDDNIRIMPYDNSL